MTTIQKVNSTEPTPANVSPKQAAQLMGIGRTMLYVEIKSGRLVARKCGRRTIIAVDDINAWLSQLPQIQED